MGLRFTWSDQDDKPVDLGSAFSGLAAMQGRQEAENRKMTADEKFTQVGGPQYIISPI